MQMLSILKILKSLHVLIKKSEKGLDAIVDDEHLTLERSLQYDHDYISTMYKLSLFVEDILSYIGGFIAQKLLKKINCSVCTIQLIQEECPSKLQKQKT